MDTEAEAQLSATERGRTFVDLSAWHRVSVVGGDAAAWLNDLVTVGVADLPPHAAGRSLLLTPTGRIRADLWVVRRDEELLLLQPPEQPDHVATLLGPYVLSSDVRLMDISATTSLIALPGEEIGIAASGSRPSVFGAGLFVRAAGSDTVELQCELEGRGLQAASLEVVEVWRIRRGIPRMGPDFDTGSLAAESGLEWTIDTSKGCFLGQESVARVRNLGHPPRVLRLVRASAPLSVGDVVTADGLSVGTLTSVAPSAGSGWCAFARVRWEAASSHDLATDTGVKLEPLEKLD